jgi:hypothetical protein
MQLALPPSGGSACAAPANPARPSVLAAKMAISVRVVDFIGVSLSVIKR